MLTVETHNQGYPHYGSGTLAAGSYSHNMDQKPQTLANITKDRFDDLIHDDI